MNRITGRITLPSPANTLTHSNLKDLEPSLAHLIELSAAISESNWSKLLRPQNRKNRSAEIIFSLDKLRKEHLRHGSSGGNYLHDRIIKLRSAIGKANRLIHNHGNTSYQRLLSLLGIQHRIIRSKGGITKELSLFPANRHPYVFDYYTEVDDNDDDNSSVCSSTFSELLLDHSDEYIAELKFGPKWSKEAFEAFYDGLEQYVLPEGWTPHVNGPTYSPSQLLLLLDDDKF